MVAEDETENEVTDLGGNDSEEGTFLLDGVFSVFEEVELGVSSIRSVFWLCEGASEAARFCWRRLMLPYV